VKNANVFRKAVATVKGAVSTAAAALKRAFAPAEALAVEAPAYNYAFA